jgi:hypothetical protein
MGHNEAGNSAATTAPDTKYSLKSLPEEDQILQKMLDAIDEARALRDAGEITEEQAKERTSKAGREAMQAVSEIRTHKWSKEHPARASITPGETTKEEVNTVGALSKDIQHLLTKAENSRKQLQAETHSGTEAQRQEIDRHVMGQEIYLQKQAANHPAENAQGKKIVKSKGNKGTKSGTVLTALLCILGVLVGFAVCIATYLILTFIIGFIGSIPFLRAIVYYPSDASWAMVVLPASTSVLASCWVCYKISKYSMPMAILIGIFWIINIISMFAFNAFSWSDFIRSILAIVCCLICFNIHD